MDVTRRGLLRTTGALGVGLLATRAGLSADSVQSQRDWAQFGYNAANTHYNQYSRGPEENVTARWTFDSGDRAPISPAVVDGTVFASFGGVLTAVDADTGDTQWTYDDGSFFHPPAVSDGRVFLADAAGRLVAVEAATGSVVWEVETATDLPAPGTVFDGTVYIGDLEALYALDTASGDEQWRVETRVTSVPAVGPNSVWAPSGKDTVVVFRNVDDRTLSETNWPDNSTEIAQLDESTVAVRFENLGSSRRGPPVLGDTHAYFGIDGLRAIDIAEGNQSWHTATDIAINSPALRDGTLYVGGSDEFPNLPDDLVANAGTVYALSSAEGTVDWTFEAAGPVNTIPVATNSVLYVPTDAGVVHALNIFTGNEVWSKEIGGQLGVPVVTGGRMYVGSTDRGLVALEERDPTPTPEPTATPTPEPTPDETPTPTPAGSGDGDDGAGNADTATPAATGSADGDGTGFGVAGGLAGLGGLWYLLRQRLDDE